MNVYSITSVPKEERLDYWHRLVCEYLLDDNAAADYHGASPSRGKLTVHDFKRLKLMQVESPQNVVRRDAACVSKAAEEFAEVAYQRKGTVVFRQAGRTVTMTPGCLSLYDSNLPHELKIANDCEQVIARIPRSQLARKIPQFEKVIARPLDGQQGIGKVVVQLLNILSTQDTSIYSDSTWHTIDALLDSTAAAVSGTYTREGEELTSSKRALLQRIKLYVSNHLASESLSPAEIAAKHGISVRYLNTLLEHEGTSITRWIRRQRLERCAADLALTSNAHRSIGEIAYAWGFNSLSYFNREFKAHYDLAPRDYRAAHLSALESDGTPYRDKPHS